MIYTPWCDEHGRVLDDGTVSRLGEDRFRWTAAEPNLRWITQERRRPRRARSRTSPSRSPRSRCRGRPAPRCSRAVAEADIDALKYFRVTTGAIAGRPVEISRTGYTGDLGYEIWMDRADAGDGLGRARRARAARSVCSPTGLLALDVARIEAGLLLIDVDFFSARKALTASQLYSPLEMGLGRLVDFGKDAIHRPRRARSRAAPAARAGASSA